MTEPHRPLRRRHGAALALPHRHGVRLALGCALALLAGCATTSAPPVEPDRAGLAGYERIPEPAGGARWELQVGERSRGAEPRRNPDPTYPAKLVALDLPPVSLDARLSVDIEGRVEAVWIRPAGEAPAWQPAFEAAVREAAGNWRFTPLEIHGEDAAAGTPQPDGQRRPFSVWYRFHFEVVDGEPVTGSAAD